MNVGNVLQVLLLGISPRDPIAIGGSALVLLLAAGISAYLPSRRAAAVDPADVLRQE